MVVGFNAMELCGADYVGYEAGILTRKSWRRITGIAWRIAIEIHSLAVRRAGQKPGPWTPRPDAIASALLLCMVDISAASPHVGA